MAAQGCDVLILPGLYNSGSEHWQSRWEQDHPSFRRVNQRDWETPDRAKWVSMLQRAISACLAPPVLVAHSLGCALIVHWAAAHHAPIRGALLVAPSDVEADTFPSGTSGFSPVPMVRLPFPSIVIASSDDPYVSLSRAKQFADAWGAHYEAMGALGHINAESNIGTWPAGFALLEKLMRS